MAHAKVYVKVFEDGVTFDEYEVVLKEGTLQTRQEWLDSNSEVPAYAPGYVLEYDGKKWIMPAKYVRFRDYERLGEEKIKAALESQTDSIRLIYSDRSI